MRLIDADVIPWVDLNADNPNSKIKVLVAFADKINKMQTIEERKRGKWIRCNTDRFRNMCECSECGSRIDIKEEFRSFFCYHCGADMRGKEK